MQRVPAAVRLLARRHHDGALAAARDVIEVVPQSAIGHLLLADMLLLTGQRSEAEAEYRRVLELRPRPPVRKMANFGLQRTSKQPLAAVKRKRGKR